MAPLICPTLGELKAFVIGDLPNTTFNRIADHIVNCNDCNGILHTLDDYSDQLVSQLAELQDPAGATTSINVPHELIVAAKSVGVTSSLEDSSISLDAGRRFAKQLENGSVRLGKFELLSELGSGSFGYVFRAHDTELDRTVAVKIQRAGSFAGDEEIDRFFREARSAAQLKHPGIVSLYETGRTEDGVCFLVSEFVEGETLQRQLGRTRPTPRQTAQYVAQLAEALDYAHEHGVIHRDVKPSNIVISADRRTHIMDFGLAKREMGERTVTSDGRVMGTPAYMSPEQARGDSHDVDSRCDVYSLGVVLYEMLSGERPFHGNRRMLMLQVVEDEPRPPRQLDDKIPRDLETICLKAMAKSPLRRYQSSREFADDLRRFLNNDSILARPEGYGERFWRWCRRYPFAVTLFLAVAVGSAVGIVHLSTLSEYFVRQTALESARMESAMLDETWRFYSELIDGLNRNKVPVKVSHQYTPRDGTLPLPATFAIDVGERISRADENLSARIYSRYPWPDRKDGGPKNEFERNALNWLERNKGRPEQRFKEYYEFTEIEGHRWLLYAKPRLMEKSCLNCHNDKKGRSPKTDWSVGDVGGVTKIGRRLDRDIAATRTGLRGAYGLIACTAVVLLTIGVAVVVGSKAKRNRSFKT